MNTSKTKRNIVLGILFFLPVAFLLMLYPAKHNYKPLDVVNNEVTDIENFYSDRTDSIALKDHITVLGFLGKSPLKKSISALNLKELVYDKFKGFKKFQIVIVVPEGTEEDVKELKKFPDAVVMEKREVDVHYQIILEDENNPDFISEALFYNTPLYYIPYRSLYSKNIKNLFMAGRNFSTSHVGLGGPRVMRTTGQMGAAVGLAASLCNKYKVNPREIYTKYLDNYLQLIEDQKSIKRSE